MQGSTFNKLKQHQTDSFELKELLQDDKRFEEFSFHFNNQGIDMLADFSKHLMTKKTLALLLELAKDAKVEEKIKEMFNGDKINVTEDRAVLHTALRYFGNDTLIIDGQDIYKDVEAVRQKMKTFSNRVITGEWKGYSNKSIKHIVNIGIGGSDLGPVMVTEALKSFKTHLTMHFVSNIDGSHIAEVFKVVDPETTLFLIASKTFTTQETMTNATSARSWFLEAAKDKKHVAKHFVALSTNESAVVDFGIDKNNMFGFWDW